MFGLSCPLEGTLSRCSIAKSQQHAVAFGMSRFCNRHRTQSDLRERGYHAESNFWSRNGVQSTAL